MSVVLKENIIGSDPVPMMETTVVFSDGDHSIESTAIVGVDLNQKGMQTSQQFGAASTYGKKYALGNMFLIDDTEDADATNKHGKASEVATKAKIPMNKVQLGKAIEFIKGGGVLSAIEAKYKLTAEQLKELNGSGSI